MLETPRLRLRRLTQDDATDYAKLIGDGEAMRFIGTGDPVSVADAARAIAASNARFDTHGFGLLAVERRSDSRLIGRVGFWIWDRRDWSGGKTLAELGEHGEVELGWALVRDAWGQGFATEAAASLRDYGLRDLGLKRLISLVHPENERSLRVAHRLGAIHERDIQTARWGPACLFRHRV